MRFTLIPVVLFLLLGCSSQPSTIQYYLLYSPEDARHSSLQKSTTVRLSRLTVPEYLKQRGMPVMTNANQVHISKSHMWAESFEVGLTKLLRFAMEPNYLLVSSAAENTSDTEVLIDILHLIPTPQGDVSISAQYQVRRGGNVVAVEAYAKQYPLKQDGYAHTVDMYRHAIFALAKEIGDKINAS